MVAFRRSRRRRRPPDSRRSGRLAVPYVGITVPYYELPSKIQVEKPLIRGAAKMNDECQAVYTHGHHESVLRSHRRRTAEASAAYLLPYLKPGSSVLDIGCG